MRKETNVVEMIEPAPDGFNVSRESWAKTPQVLRDEIWRMVKELAAGTERYRPAAERNAELAPFHLMAEKGGTTLAAALSRYIAMENLLRADPIKGIEAVAKNAGIDLEAWAQRVLEAECA